MGTNIYAVGMVVYGSTTVFVEAETEDDALDKASEFTGMIVRVCHQCSRDVCETTIGELHDEAEAILVDAQDEKEARVWIKANS